MAARKTTEKIVKSTRKVQPKKTPDPARSEAAKRAAATRAANKAARTQGSAAKPTSTLLPVAERLAKLVEIREAFRDELLTVKAQEDLMLEELATEVLNNEPQGTPEQSPVVSFKRTYKGGTTTYEYVAIGIGEYNRAIGLDGNLGHVECVRKWYLSSSQSHSPLTWAQLVKFMGVTGLTTLQLLR